MNNEQDSNTETVFVSKYDVLLTVNSEGELEFFLPFSSDDSLNDSHRAADRAPPLPLPQQLQRQQSQPHVGNNRFSILCKMYLTEFRMADTEQQQTAVLQKLHDMISQQCIDSACARAGKFLLRQDEHAQSSRSGGWVELTREQAYSFIRSSLELEQVKSAAGLVNVPPSSSQTTLQDDKKRRRHSSLLRRSMSGGDVTAGSDQKKRIAQRQSIRPSIRQSTIHLAQFLEGVDFDCDDENDNGNNDADQTMMIDAPQNSSSSPVMMLQRAGSWCANNDDKQHVVQTANALDVILRIDPSTLSYSLVPNHTGNNRIGVMIQMQTSKYVALRESQGTAISVCRDLVDMVKDNYCGKFLVQVNNGQDDDYRCLTDEQAISALDSVFSIAAAAEIAQKPAPPAVAAVYNNNKQDETLSQVDPIPISFAWNGSAGGGGDAHKTAREELQRRKKRQGFNTKISQLVAKTSLERSHSVGSSGPIPIPLPSPTRISKFSTTGGMTERTTAANHDVDGSRPYSASLPVSMPSATINDLFEQQDETEDDIGEPLDVEPLSPEALRRPTLSAFSRAMIQDMLTRLDVVHDDGDLGNGV